MDLSRLIVRRFFAYGDKLNELQAHFARQFFTLGIPFQPHYVFLDFCIYTVCVGEPLFKFGDLPLRAFLFKLILFT